jgi:hypothetical protein
MPVFLRFSDMPVGLMNDCMFGAACLLKARGLAKVRVKIRVVDLNLTMIPMALLV